MISPSGNNVLPTSSGAGTTSDPNNVEYESSPPAAALSGEEMTSDGSAISSSSSSSSRSPHPPPPSSPASFDEANDPTEHSHDDDDYDEEDDDDYDDYDDEDDLDDDRRARGEEEFNISVRTGTIMATYRAFLNDIEGGSPGLGRGMDDDDLEGGGSSSMSYSDAVNASATSPPPPSWSSSNPFLDWGRERVKVSAISASVPGGVGTRGSSGGLDDVVILDDTSDVLDVEDRYGEIGRYRDGRRRYDVGGNRRYRLDLILRSRSVRRSIIGAIAIIIGVVVIGTAMSSSSSSSTSSTSSTGGGGEDVDVVVEKEEEPTDIENSRLVASYQKYEPRWFDRSGGWTGSSHPEAMSFCSGQVSYISRVGMTLCPYDAICPNGPNESPLALQHVIEDGDQSSPILEDDGGVGVGGGGGEWTWMYLGGTRMCTTNLRGDADGANGNWYDVTGHVACCVSPVAQDLQQQTVAVDIIEEAEDEAGEVPITTAAPESLSESELESESSKELLVASYQKHEPQWFDRTTGWQGSTFGDAMEFCSGITSYITEVPMTLCPYDAMCPLGVNTSPAVLSSEQDDTQRSPIIDFEGAYVYLGGEKKCTGEYFNVNSTDKDVTRNVMCCLPVVDDAADIVSGGADDADNSDITADPYEGAKTRYRPTVYDSSNGWVGETYDAAVIWCASEERNGEKQALCPYEAYCPLGPHSMPYGGYSKDVSGTVEARMLAPIYNNRDWWVDIGNVNPCLLYEELPDWASDGTGDESLLTRILCCAANAALETTGHVGSIDAWVPISTTPAVVTADDSVASSTTTDATAPLMVDWGGVELNSETGPPTASTTTVADAASDSSESSLVSSDTLLSLVKKFTPTLWDRTSGWLGQTYQSAIKFCSDNGGIPCPYEAYCPLGPGQHVVGGIRSMSSFAPVMSIPNGWVSIGPDNTCMPYNSYNSVPPEWGLSGVGNEEITRHIMCCAEPIPGSELYMSVVESDGLEYDVATDAERSEAEQSIMDEYHPVWYSRRQGYHGASIDEAKQFCNNVAGMTLCPLEAVCPDGPPSESIPEALFLDRPSFDGEQWLPVSGMFFGDDRPDWVAIGTVGGHLATTCATLTSLQDAAKLWDGLDTPSEHKQYVLCCEKQVAKEDDLEVIVKNLFDPIWYGKRDGWRGGTLNDASEFCIGRNGRQLCPYSAYCPYMAGNAVFRGHRDDFDIDGELWAPATNNEWIMIGQKFRNSATTCTVGLPPQGNVSAVLQMHIMCCLPKGVDFDSNS